MILLTMLTMRIGVRFFIVQQVEVSDRDELRPMSHLQLCRASLKTSRATVRRAMTQRATRPVTLATLTRDFVARVTSV